MIEEILLFTTGLVLFLFGIVKLSTEVQQLFTVRIREYVKYSVKRPIYGLITGLITTVLFQSSSATTVLTVGMVSAGLISFYHSLGIILGADIGTTITLQLVVWKITAIAPLFVVAGGILWIAARGKWKMAGEAMFYFGLIFFGLSLAAQATYPLKGNQTFINLFRETKNPLLGVCVGLIFTSIIHASVIPISILVILGQQGLITIDNALPIVLGANIGTTATALLASIGASINGKRSAFAHFLFKLLGVTICLIFFPFFLSLLRALSSSVAQQISLGHLLFNLFVASVFIFLLKPISGLVKKVIRGPEEVLPLWPEFLDDKYLTKPEEALNRVRKELKREIILAQKMFFDSFRLLSDFREGKRKDITYVELVVDNLQTEIAKYLWKISSTRLSPELSKKLFAFTAMVDDIERIGDHSMNLVSLARYKHWKKAEFSEEAKIELNEIENLVAENLGEALFLVEKRDEEKIKKIFACEEEIDLKTKEAREKHLERFHRGICQAEAGPIFVDILINLERISDHCVNIAEYIEDLPE